ncbi:MAG: T9SS type A sorting domain-containing protein [Bacteroidetes bacterium]|nr:T9SS type A sorting domain-containing protein [Bacteroidota bacterium]
MREISAQNTFNGMNMLNAHFGFGVTGATPLTIDTIRIEWPSGILDVCTSVLSNVMYIATEGQCLLPTSLNSFENSKIDYFSLSIYPNPISDHLSFKYNLHYPEIVQIDILDINGKCVHSEKLIDVVSGSNASSLDIKNIATGFYTLKLSSGKHISHGKFVKN